MFHACVERFDVMDGRENILGWNGEVKKAANSRRFLDACINYMDFIKDVTTCTAAVLWPCLNCIVSVASHYSNFVFI
jgi:hypothetical protein